MFQVPDITQAQHWFPKPVSVPKHGFITPRNRIGSITHQGYTSLIVMLDQHHPQWAGVKLNCLYINIEHFGKIKNRMTLSLGEQNI